MCYRYPYGVPHIFNAHTHTHNKVFLKKFFFFSESEKSRKKKRMVKNTSVDKRKSVFFFSPKEISINNCQSIKQPFDSTLGTIGTRQKYTQKKKKTEIALLSKWCVLTGKMLKFFHMYTVYGISFYYIL